MFTFTLSCLFTFFVYIRFSHGLLEERGIDTTNGLIIVTKPQMGRRAYATFSKQWPTSGQNQGQLPVKLPPPIVCSSQAAGWPEYIIGSNIERNDLIAILVGDLQRIWKYAFPPTGKQCLLSLFIFLFTLHSCLFTFFVFISSNRLSNSSGCASGRQRGF